MLNYVAHIVFLWDHAVLELTEENFRISWKVKTPAPGILEFAP